MKKLLFAFLGTVLGISLITPRANAIVCFGEPVSCVIAAGGLLVGIVASIRAAHLKPEIQSMQLTADVERMRAIAAAVESTPKFYRSTYRYAYEDSGYRDIVQRYDEGSIEGRGLTLTGLYKFNPKLFASLDRFESIVAPHFSQEEMVKAYGTVFDADGNPVAQAGSMPTNWLRYRNLADDMLALWNNNQSKTFKAQTAPAKIYWQQESYSRQ